MRVKRLFITALITGLTLSLGGLSARADDLSDALAKAPQGIQLSKYFEKGASVTNYTNNAQVGTVTTSPFAKNTGYVQLTTDNTKQAEIGSIWSKSGFEFDLNKDQTASMWLYFGNKGVSAADGMALVLQNDAKGASAIAGTNSDGKRYGEALGVWGADANSTNNSLQATTGIQNSWALEFDTNLNSTFSSSNTGLGNAFDINQISPHISWGYPGNTGDYSSKGVSGSLGRTYYSATLAHRNTIDGDDYTFLSNGAWHHLIFKWDHTTKKFTYSFDDKDPTTGGPTGKTRTITTPAIDTTKFASSTGKLRWGFTGSTGTNSLAENNLVIFEQIPDLIETTASAKLTDKTSGTVIDSSTAGTQTLNGNDEVQVDYQAGYTSGKDTAWSNISANLNLPTNITYKSATVTYDGQEAETLSLDGLSSSQIAYTLKDLSADNPGATISLKGTVNNVSTSSATAATTSRFVGDNAVQTVTIPGFNVKQVVNNLKLSISNSLPINTSTGHDVTIKGIVSGSQAPNSGITVTPTLNGTALDKVTLSNSDAAGAYSFTIPAAKLNEGDNALVLKASDTNDETSTAVTAQITVGTLVFDTVSKNGNFETTALTGKDQDVDTDGGWQLSVKDTRVVGSHWNLLARVSSPFVADGQKLSGNLVYDNGTQQTISDQDTAIYSYTKQDVSENLIDIAGTWKNDQGLLLHVNSNNTAGTYKGEITWTLQDAPE